MRSESDVASDEGTSARASGLRRLVATPLWWVRVTVLTSFAFLAAVWVAHPLVVGDTPFVLDGTNAFLDCLAQRDLVACRLSEELSYWGLTSPIGDWPLLQHIPDAISVELGVTSHPARTRFLVVLSAAGIVGAVAMARVVLSRVGWSAWFWGFMLVVVSGPFLFYGRATAGEALAAGLLVCLVSATVLRAPPPVVALAALGASLTKETAYPFVAVLAVLGLVLARERTGERIRRHVVWGAAGVALGMVLASLFNVVRFGSVLNTNYLEPELRTPGLARPLEYALALLVSPNGGILVYWPAASAILIAACLLPLLPAGRDLDLLPALTLIGVAVALTLGFAAWWDPFGSLWGPRLTLPWVLPLVLMGLVAYGRALGGLATRLLTPWWRLLVVFAVLFALALPHVGHMWRPQATEAFYADETPPCDAPWRGGVEAWHACQHERLWFERLPLPVHSLEGIANVGGVVTSIAVALALLGCLILLRDELPRCLAKERRGA